MDPFYRMVYKENLEINKKVNKFSDPILRNFGVKHFWYFRVTKDGQYTCLGSNQKWMEYYFGEKLYLKNPYLINPESYETSINFVKQLKDYSYQEISTDNQNLFLSQSLIFIDKIEGGIEGYGFATDIESDAFEKLCVNEMPTLKLFVKKFCHEFKPNLKLMVENSVDIGSMMETPSYEKNQKILIPKFDKQSILRHFQLSEILELSKREKDVLLCVSKGLIAAQTATLLHISKRTVEHHIESIKNKLNCETKAELIQKANEFLSIGYSL